MSQPSRARTTAHAKRSTPQNASSVTRGKKPARAAAPGTLDPRNEVVRVPDQSLHEEVSHDLSSPAPGEAFSESAGLSEVLPEFQEQVAKTYGRNANPDFAAEVDSKANDLELEDAWYGSFERLPDEEPGFQEAIIGKDDRVRVTNTTAYPYGCICHLVIRARNGKGYVGTGWLADEQTVVTAGHNLYMHLDGGWAASIEVYPGRDGTSMPYKARAVRTWSTRGWTEQKSAPADYGAIRLDQKIDGLGTFGFGALTDEELRANLFHIVGYPGDKRGEMWGHGRRLSKVYPDVLVYDIDTMPGNSGGPLFMVRNGDSIVAGIHNYGANSGNSATRITSDVYQRIRGWISA